MLLQTKLTFFSTIIVCFGVFSCAWGIKASGYLADLDGDNIPGEAGVDYPVLGQIPEDIIFPCENYEYAGYFGDVGTGCQVYHVCWGDGRQQAFLCPNGTVFHQRFFVCDWWFHFNCSHGPSMYKLNKNRRLPLPPAPHPKRLPKVLQLNKPPEDLIAKNKAKALQDLKDKNKSLAEKDKHDNPLNNFSLNKDKNPHLKERKEVCECRLV